MSRYSPRRQDGSTSRAYPDQTTTVAATSRPHPLSTRSFGTADNSPSKTYKRNSPLTERGSPVSRASSFSAGRLSSSSRKNDTAETSGESPAKVPKASGIPQANSINRDGTPSSHHTRTSARLHQDNTLGKLDSLSSSEYKHAQCTTDSNLPSLRRKSSVDAATKKEFSRIGPRTEDPATKKESSRIGPRTEDPATKKESSRIAPMTEDPATRKESSRIGPRTEDPATRKESSRIAPRTEDPATRKESSRIAPRSLGRGNSESPSRSPQDSDGGSPSNIPLRPSPKRGVEGDKNSDQGASRLLRTSARPRAASGMIGAGSAIDEVKPLSTRTPKDLKLGDPTNRQAPSVNKTDKSPRVKSSPDGVRSPSSGSPNKEAESVNMTANSKTGSKIGELSKASSPSRKLEGTSSKQTFDRGDIKYNSCRSRIPTPNSPSGSRKGSESPVRQKLSSHSFTAPRTGEPANRTSPDEGCPPKETPESRAERIARYKDIRRKELASKIKYKADPETDPEPESVNISKTLNEEKPKTSKQTDIVTESSTAAKTNAARSATADSSKIICGMKVSKNIADRAKKRQERMLRNSQHLSAELIGRRAKISAVCSKPETEGSENHQTGESDLLRPEAGPGQSSNQLQPSPSREMDLLSPGSLSVSGSDQDSTYLQLTSESSDLSPDDKRLSLTELESLPETRSSSDELNLPAEHGMVDSFCISEPSPSYEDVPNVREPIKSSESPLEEFVVAKKPDSLDLRLTTPPKIQRSSIEDSPENYMATSSCNLSSSSPDSRISKLSSGSTFKDSRIPDLSSGLAATTTKEALNKENNPVTSPFEKVLRKVKSPPRSGIPDSSLSPVLSNIGENRNPKREEGNNDQPKVQTSPARNFPTSLSSDRIGEKVKCPPGGRLTDANISSVSTGVTDKGRRDVSEPDVESDDYTPKTPYKISQDNDRYSPPKSNEDNTPFRGTEGMSEHDVQRDDYISKSSIKAKDSSYSYSPPKTKEDNSLFRGIKGMSEPDVPHDDYISKTSIKAKDSSYSYSPPKTKEDNTPFRGIKGMSEPDVQHEDYISKNSIKAKDSSYSYSPPKTKEDNTPFQGIKGMSEPDVQRDNYISKSSIKAKESSYSYSPPKTKEDNAPFPGIKGVSEPDEPCADYISKTSIKAKGSSHSYSPPKANEDNALFRSIKGMSEPDVQRDDYISKTSIKAKDSSYSYSLPKTNEDKAPFQAKSASVVTDNQTEGLAKLPFEKSRPRPPPSTVLYTKKLLESGSVKKDQKRIDYDLQKELDWLEHRKYQYADDSDEQKEKKLSVLEMVRAAEGKADTDEEKPRKPLGRTMSEARGRDATQSRKEILANRISNLGRTRSFALNSNRRAEPSAVADEAPLPMRESNLDELLMKNVAYLDDENVPKDPGVRSLHPAENLKLRKSLRKKKVAKHMSLPETGMSEEKRSFSKSESIKELGSAATELAASRATLKLKEHDPSSSKVQNVDSSNATSPFAKSPTSGVTPNSNKKISPKHDVTQKPLHVTNPVTNVTQTSKNLPGTRSIATKSVSPTAAASYKASDVRNKGLPSPEHNVTTAVPEQVDVGDSPHRKRIRSRSRGRPTAENIVDPAKRRRDKSGPRTSRLGALEENTDTKSASPHQELSPPEFPTTETSTALHSFENSNASTRPKPASSEGAPPPRRSRQRIRPEDIPAPIRDVIKASLGYEQDGTQPKAEPSRSAEIAQLQGTFRVSDAQRAGPQTAVQGNSAEETIKEFEEFAPVMSRCLSDTNKSTITTIKNPRINPDSVSIQEQGQPRALKTRANSLDSATITASPKIAYNIRKFSLAENNNTSKVLPFHSNDWNSADNLASNLAPIKESRQSSEKSVSHRDAEEAEKGLGLSEGTATPSEPLAGLDRNHFSGHSGRAEDKSKAPAEDLTDVKLVVREDSNHGNKNREAVESAQPLNFQSTSRISLASKPGEQTSSQVRKPNVTHPDGDYSRENVLSTEPDKPKLSSSPGTSTTTHTPLETTVAHNKTTISGSSKISVTPSVPVTSNIVATSTLSAGSDTVVPSTPAKSDTVVSSSSSAKSNTVMSSTPSATSDASLSEVTEVPVTSKQVRNTTTGSVTMPVSVTSEAPSNAKLTPHVTEVISSSPVSQNPIGTSVTSSENVTLKPTVTNVTKNTVTNVTKPGVTEERKLIVTNDIKPAVTDETRSVANVTQPAVTNVTKPGVTEERKPIVTNVIKPAVTDETRSVVNVTQPTVTNVTKPPVTGQQKPAGTNVTRPSVTNESVTKAAVANVTKPTVSEKNEHSVTNAMKPTVTDETKAITEPAVTNVTVTEQTKSVKNFTNATVTDQTKSVTNATKPLVTNATKPAVTDQSKSVTKPTVLEETEHGVTNVTKPAVTNATVTDQTKPVTNATKPTVTDQTKAVTKPVVTDEIKHSVTNVTKPPVTNATVTDQTKPVTNATKPAVTDQTKAVTKPVVTDKIKHSVTNVTKPAVTNTTVTKPVTTEDQKPILTPTSKAPIKNIISNTPATVTTVTTSAMPVSTNSINLGQTSPVMTAPVSSNVNSPTITTISQNTNVTKTHEKTSPREEKTVTTPTSDLKNNSVSKLVTSTPTSTLSTGMTNQSPKTPNSSTAPNLRSVSLSPTLPESQDLSRSLELTPKDIENGNVMTQSAQFSQPRMSEGSISVPRRGILKRSSSLRSNNVNNELIDPELAVVFQARRIKEKSENPTSDDALDEEEEEDEDDSAFSGKFQGSDSLLSEIMAESEGSGEKPLSVAERISKMETKISISTSGCTTPKTPRSRLGSVARTLSEHESKKSVLSQEELFNKLTDLARSKEASQERQKRYHRSRDDWRTRTQPVTLKEVEQADSLQSVCAFRALVMKRSSINIFEQLQELDKRRRLSGPKTEYPQPYTPPTKRDRKNNRRYKTLPVTAEELMSIPESETISLEFLKSQIQILKESKVDSGIVSSGSDVEKESLGSDSARSLTTDADNEDDDFTQMSVAARASLFQQMEEKSKKSASGAKRYIDRKRRERSRTQPITEEEVKTAAEIAEEDSRTRRQSLVPKDTPTQTIVEIEEPQSVADDSNEPVHEPAITLEKLIQNDLREDEKDVTKHSDELTRQTLADKVKLFSSEREVTQDKPNRTDAPVIRRRNRRFASRFSTQPITTEEMENVFRISPLAISLVKPPDPDILKGLPLNAQRELIAQYAETCLSQQGSRAGSRAGSRPGSLAGSRRGSIEESEESKAETKGILKMADYQKDLQQVKSILKSESGRDSPEREIKSILKADADRKDNEPSRSILKQDSNEQVQGETRSILKSSSEPEPRRSSKQLDSEPRGILKSSETMETNSVAPKTSEPKSALKKDSHLEKNGTEPRGILKKESSFDCKKEPEKGVLKYSDSKDGKEVPCQDGLQGILKKESSIENLTSEDSDIGDVLTTAEKQLAPGEGEGKKKEYRRGSDERYLTQPVTEVEKKSPESPRKLQRYGSRQHKTQPITPEEKKEATQVIQPVVKMSGSLAERLQALQKSGEEDWKKRLSKHSNSPSPSPDRELRLSSPETTPVRPANLSERMSLLRSSQTSWRSRVEESDAKAFTVEGKLSKSGQMTRERSVVTKVKQTVKCTDPDQLNSATSPTTPTKGEWKIPIPKEIIVSETTSLEETSDHSPTIVKLPELKDDGLDQFFGSSPNLFDKSELLDISVDDFDEIFQTSQNILIHSVKARPKKKVQARSKNPLKSRSANLERQEYEEYKTNVAEMELKRIKKEALSKDAGFAEAALAGLASKENFSKIELRKTDTSVPSPGGNRYLPYKPLMLLHIKGRRHVQTRLVEPCCRNVNLGDCYVLVTPEKVINWIGEYSNIIEKAKSADIAAHIQQKKDMGFKASSGVITIDSRKTSGSVFWSLLDGHESECQECGGADEDEIYENAIISTNMVYQIEKNRLVPFEEYWGGLPRYEMLKSHQVFVFDFGAEVYIWQGKKAVPQRRRLGMELAQQLFDKGYNYEMSSINPLSPLQGVSEGGSKGSSSQRPSWSLIAKVNENMETVLFREKFADWPDSARLIKVKSVDSNSNKTDNGDLIPYDAQKLIEKKIPEALLMTLDGSQVGRGTYWSEDMGGFIQEFEINTLAVTVWHILEFDHYRLDPLSNGQFHDGDTYVVRWEYRIVATGAKGGARRSAAGRERCAYFFWQGQTSTITEKGASALMTVELDEERGPQVRVLQGKEPPCFLNLFQGQMVVHIGKREEEETNTQGAWRFYALRNEKRNEMCLIEIDAQISSLRSRSSFILFNTQSGKVYVWHGAKSPQNTRKLAVEAVNLIEDRHPLEMGLAENIHVNITEMNEGSEKPEFWMALRSRDRSRYVSLLNDPRSYNVSLRLFQFTSVSGVIEVTEIRNPTITPDHLAPYPFLQSDLYKVSQPALFLLDCGYEVYLWQGWWPEGDEEIENVLTGSAQSRLMIERRCAMQTAVDYCQAKNVSTPIKPFLVFAGLEPLKFTNIFPFWNIDHTAKELSLKDGKIDGDLVSVEDELNRLSLVRYSFKELLERPLPEDVDPLKLESYLSDQEFEDVLKMTRSEYYELPTWKQSKLKQDIGLF